MTFNNTRQNKKKKGDAGWPAKVKPGGKMPSKSGRGRKNNPQHPKKSGA